MFNKLGSSFEISLTIIKDQIRRAKKLEENKILFQVIERRKKTWIKGEHKQSIKFFVTTSNIQSQEKNIKEKRKFTYWQISKEFGNKHLIDQIYKRVNNKCDINKSKREYFAIL